jgi:phosphoribosylamine--glycine ligase
MITETGPQLLEYNCRFGDPEAQVVIPLIDADFAALLLSAAQGTMQSQSVRRHAGFTVCVVMASRGYPDAVEVGNTISGCESFANRQDLVLFHAGTKRKDGALVTAGGRVLGVTALGFGQDLETTIERAYRAVESISFEGAQFRRDIGRKALSKVHGMRA